MTSPAQADTSLAVHVQLLPHNENPDNKPTLKEVIDRKLREGHTVRIGRQVVKDGQPQGRAANPLVAGMDIWFTSKVISRNHAELWTKAGQVYVKDIGSSSGTFLNKMRLSPSGKESRPYPLKEGDVLQFGIDYKGKQEDIYKSVVAKVGFFDNKWLRQQKKRGNSMRFKQALKQLLAATNPYGSSKVEPSSDDGGTTDCCICIGTIGPYQALFIAPCSHCYHYKCISSIISQSPMFQCPLCRQVANLAASVSMESLFDSNEDISKTEDECEDSKKNDTQDERMSECESDNSLSYPRPSSAPLPDHDFGDTLNFEAAPMDIEPPELGPRELRRAQGSSGDSINTGSHRDDQRSRTNSVEPYNVSKLVNRNSGMVTPDRDSITNSPEKTQSGIANKFSTFLGRKAHNNIGDGNSISGSPSNSPGLNRTNLHSYNDNDAIDAIDANSSMEVINT